MARNTCIVIGSGVSGLVAAALMSAKDYQVTVIEQSQTYGGKMGRIAVGDASFDTGPSLCTDPDIIDAVYKKCKKNPRDYWDYEKLSELTRYFWPADASEYTMPQGAARIERSLVNTLGEQPNKVRKYMAKTTGAYKLVAPYYTNRRLSVTSLLRPGAVRALAHILPMMFNTLHRRNARYFSNKKTVQVFDRYATYSGSNPFLAPSITVFAGLPEITKGAFFPVGGMCSIADGLQQLCVDMGVEFAFDTKVTNITSKDGKVQSIKASGKTYLCNELIYSGDIVRLYELLGDTAMKQKYSKPERSSSAVVFYWEVRGSHKRFGLHNVIFSNDYKQEYSQLRRGDIPDDPTIYLNISSKIDTLHAAKGTENWFVMINVPAGTHDVAVLALKDRVKEKIEQMLGGYITILNESYISPTLIDAQTGAWQGAIYGQATNSLVALLSRAQDSGRSVPRNLHRVGGTVHPGGGIPLVVRSAFIATSKL